MNGRILAIGLILLCALVLLSLAVLYRWQPLETVDRVISQGLENAVGARPGFVDIVQAVSNVGDPVTWRIVHTLAVVLLLVRRHIREALFVAVTAAGGGALTTAIKVGIGRQRPEWTEPVSWAGGFAFPSGHTTGTAIGVTVLLIIVLPRLPVGWGWPLASVGAVLVVAVGASRVVLGVHWFSDVLGGLLFSGAWVLIALAVICPKRQVQTTTSLPTG